MLRGYAVDDLTVRADGNGDVDLLARAVLKERLISVRNKIEYVVAARGGINLIDVLTCALGLRDLGNG